MRLPQAVITFTCVLVAAACRSENTLVQEVFDPSELAGEYPLNQVDGHAPGWYHHLGAVDCQVAFMQGELTLSANGAFFLHLDYNIRCLGPAPFDGTGTLGIIGNSMTEEKGVVVLRGSGPNLVAPQLGVDNWTLELRRNDPLVTLRFAGFYREFWADPVLTMGPRQ